MTSAELLARVINRLAPDAEGETVNRVSFAVTMATKDALIQLGHECAKSTNSAYSQLFQKDFTVTLTAGVGSLTTPKTASEPLLAEYIDKAEIYHSSFTEPLQWVPDVASLKRDLRGVYAYFTVDGNNLRTRNTDGSLTSLTGDLTISGPYAPALSSVPTELEDRLVEIVTGMVKIDGRVEDTASK